MWTFFAVQETEEDVKALLCNILQISFSNPGNRFICACSEEAFNFINGFGIENIDLVHRNIPSDWSIKNYAKNWLETVRYAIENEEKPVYISRDLYLTQEVPITQEHIDQGVAFIKKDTLAPSLQKEMQYSTDLLFVNNIRFVETVEKYYREHTDLFEEPEPEREETNDMTVEVSVDENDNVTLEVSVENNDSGNDADNEADTDETPTELTEEQKKELEERKAMIKCYQEAWVKIPILFSGMDDGVLSVSEYIDGSGYLSTQNFFAYEKSWKIGEMGWKEGFKHNDTDIWGMNIRLNEMNPQVRDLNNKLVNMLLQCEPRFMPLLNMRWSSNGIEILVPKKEGLAHWSRENDNGFYNFINAIAEHQELYDSRTKECSADYFLFNNHILFDKPDVKYITNTIKKSFGIMYFDYTQELLDALSEIDIKSKFGGYYSSYPKILEEFTIDENVERIGTKTVKETDFTNEEDFKLYLDDLATFKYVSVNKDTPRNRIADCLRLGLVPRIEDNSPLLQLEDIANSDDDWEILSNKCREYYSNNLSIKEMGNKLLAFAFSK